jgi:hypothetical protein
MQEVLLAWFQFQDIESSTVADATRMLIGNWMPVLKSRRKFSGRHAAKVEIQV